MFKKRDIILLIFISIILGIIIVRQFYSQKKVREVSEPEAGNSMALEVAELIKTNAKMRKEISQLNDNLTKLNESTSNSQKANETINENLNVYQIILGLTNIQGPGVAIIFNNKMESTQIVDLVNAIKNIGAEAISINDKRLGPRTSIEEKVLYPPVKVSVIGDANLLHDSLVRPGGIIEQIGAGNVEKNDNIYIKAI